MSDVRVALARRLLKDPWTLLPLALAVLSLFELIFGAPLRVGGHFFPHTLVGHCLMILLWLSYGVAIYRNRDLGRPFARLMLALALLNVAIGAWGLSIQIEVARMNPVSLLRSAQIGDLRHVDFLLSRRMADPDARDDEGRTALMLAAQSGQVEVIKSLLRAGAGRDLVDKDGRTARLLAQETFHADAAAALDNGAPPPKEIAPPRFEAGSFEHPLLRRSEGAQRLFLQISAEADLDLASFWLGLFGPEGHSQLPGCEPNSYRLYRAGAGLYAADIDANRCFPLPKDRPVTLRVGYFSVFDRAGRQLRVGKEVGRRFVFPKRLQFRLSP